ncbi:hypothetical protein ACFHW2_07705 [Actinomadura sp. LOL_016]|uniref:hypothetical protein n=1 Tax=unclassified Actinomadura TaxID=2626254 RepID=UPI003A7F6FD4
MRCGLDGPAPDEEPARHALDLGGRRQPQRGVGAGGGPGGEQAAERAERLQRAAIVPAEVAALDDSRMRAVHGRARAGEPGRQRMDEHRVHVLGARVGDERAEAGRTAESASGFHVEIVEIDGDAREPAR